jgi:hypothetical protein
MQALFTLTGLLALESSMLAQTAATAEPSNPVTTTLAFAHSKALPKALAAGKDRQLKIKLIEALGKSPELPWDAVSDCFDKSEFQKLTGGDTAISLTVMDKHVRNGIPQSRKDLNAKTRQHADLLATQFDMIESAHDEPAEKIVAWIVKHYETGKPLDIVTICTGNTRRSALSAAMGNIAAAYYGLPELRYSSGGTMPDAINPRTIAALKEIGFEIEPTGEEGTRGATGKANPIYRIKWGKGMETKEFSKKYSDAANPQKDFAAILVCSDADASCPTVAGASIRIPLPYLDPKAFDGAPFEAAKYAERRDDMGRFMLCVTMQARRHLELAGKLK